MEIRLGCISTVFCTWKEAESGKTTVYKYPFEQSSSEGLGGRIQKDTPSGSPFQYYEDYSSSVY
jgi:hypothetical protein